MELSLVKMTSPTSIERLWHSVAHCGFTFSYGRPFLSAPNPCRRCKNRILTVHLMSLPDFEHKPGPIPSRLRSEISKFSSQAVMNPPRSPVVSGLQG